MATWRAYYSDTDGELLAHGWIPDRPPPPGFSVRVYGAAQPAGAWDPVARDYDGVVPKPRLVSTYQFIVLWTQAERTLLRANTSEAAEDFRFVLQLAGEVDLDSDYIIDRLTQAVSAGILTAARAQAIQRGDDL